MSRPSMPTNINVSKNGKKIELIGFAYLESYNPRGVRIYVPGYSEDFVITNLRGSNATKVLDQWIKFSVFAETMKFDPEVPLMMVADPIPSRSGTIIVLCEKVGSIVKTVTEGHVVTDPGNELGSRGLDENWKTELRLILKSGLPNKPVFVVDKYQSSLPSRVVPREPVKAQNPQPRGYSMRQNHERNQHQNSANNSDLTRYLHPQTSGSSRPSPGFYNGNSNEQQTPPPTFGNVQGKNDEFSNGRRPALSTEYHCPPRNFPGPTTSHNYSNSSGRTYIREMQNSQAEKDKKIADLVRTELKNPKFREMMLSNLPDVTSRFLALL